MPQPLANDLFTQNRILGSGPDRYALPPALRRAMWSAAVGPMPRLPGLDATHPFLWFDSAVQRLAALYRQSPFIGSFASQIRNIAQALDTQIARAPDACIAAAIQLPLRPHTAARAVQTATILSALRPLLPRDDAQHRTLLSAALSMNVATWAFQDELDAQETPLSSGQLRELHLHPLQSSAWLSEMGIEDALWHRLVQQQHERPNGSGYPFRLRNEALDPLAHQLQLVDDVMAKISPRGTRQPLPTDLVLKQLLSQEDGNDARLSAALIKTLGCYPPGMFVRLANGKLAIVTRRSEQITHPRVAWLGQDGVFVECSSLEPGFEIMGMAELRTRGDRFTGLARAWGY